MDKQQNRVALVTGAAGGIGAATARALTSSGVTVVMCDLPSKAGEELARGLRATFCALDVTSEDAWLAAVELIESRFSRLDVLVNAAGIEGDVVAGTPELTSLSEWRRVLAVNLDGTFLGCKSVLPLMKRAGKGAIVNVSSIASYYPTPQSVAYGASKGAVTQLTKSIAFYGSLEGMKIRCNSIHPGLIDTPLLTRIYSQLGERADGAWAERANESLRRIPLGGAGQPEDVAGAISFLASEEARYITGAELSIDGGWRLVR